MGRRRAHSDYGALWRSGWGARWGRVSSAQGGATRGLLVCCGVMATRLYSSGLRGGTLGWGGGWKISGRGYGVGLGGRVWGWVRGWGDGWLTRRSCARLARGSGRALGGRGGRG